MRRVFLLKTIGAQCAEAYITADVHCVSKRTARLMQRGKTEVQIRTTDAPRLQTYPELYHFACSKSITKLIILALCVRLGYNGIKQICALAFKRIREYNAILRSNNEHLPPQDTIL